LHFCTSHPEDSTQNIKEKSSLEQGSSRTLFSCSTTFFYNVVFKVFLKNKHLKIILVKLLATVELSPKRGLMDLVLIFVFVRATMRPQPDV